MINTPAVKFFTRLDIEQIILFTARNRFKVNG